MFGQSMVKVSLLALYSNSHSLVPFSSTLTFELNHVSFLCEGGFFPHLYPLSFIPVCI